MYPGGRWQACFPKTLPIPAKRYSVTVEIHLDDFVSFIECRNIGEWRKGDRFGLVRFSGIRCRFHSGGKVPVVFAEAGPGMPGWQIVRGAPVARKPFPDFVKKAGEPCLFYCLKPSGIIRRQ